MSRSTLSIVLKNSIVMLKGRIIKEMILVKEMIRQQDKRQIELNINKNNEDGKR